MNIYVGNLSLDLTEDELRYEFALFGEVVSVTLMNDKYIGSGQPIAYGFVEMASADEGKAALAALAGKKLLGYELEAIEALPLSEKRERRHAGSRRLARKRHR